LGRTFRSAIALNYTMPISKIVPADS
jgi:hypothetical protein